MSKDTIDLSLFKWCDASALDELNEKTEVVEVLGYEEFLKLPVNELYAKNKTMREERIKKDIEEHKKKQEESLKVTDTVDFHDILQVD
jgi:hypothetical protein